MVALRRCDINDMQQYFAWRNDNLVRQSAFNSEVIDWENHKKWFKGKLNDKNSFLYFAENGQENIGQVRFDCKENKAIIDYSISISYRGRGFGNIIVQQSIERIVSDCLYIKIIEASVKKTNIASNKIFIKLGFKEQNITKHMVCYQLHLS